MASISYFAFSPTALLSLIGLYYGVDKTKPDLLEGYSNATVDLVIPAYNEEKNIVYCLQSVAQQTVRPGNILLVDDGSTDRTSLLAASFAESIGLNVTIIRREVSEGKTPTIFQAANESTADILCVLDADTMFTSENYIEKLVFELYQGVGIACACGIIQPVFERDRVAMQSTPGIAQFSVQFPEVKNPKNTTWRQRIEQNIANNYRTELYLFLQQFIYYGEMFYCGTIINPVGCAVAYKRQYLVDILKLYSEQYGFDLTYSEDIFIGFAFANEGYRNIQIQDIFALTGEPRISKVPRQIKLWSGSFLQSCYYFDALVKTPFKLPKLIYKKITDIFNPKHKEIIERRKIKEAYRQSFGKILTKEYGRPIGWFIFASLLEKIFYPTVIIIFILLKLWEPLVITVFAELLIYTIIISILHTNRLRNVTKSICYMPIRYFFLLLDFFIIFNFGKDLWITKNRKWRK